MSNFIKSGYVRQTPVDKTRIINSNLRMDEMIRGWRTDSASVGSTDILLSAEPEENQFVDGIEAEILEAEGASPEEIALTAKKSAEQILEEARTAADQLLKNAEREAQTWIEDQRLSAMEQGKADADAYLRQQLEEQELSLEQRRRELESAYQSRMDEMEHDIVSAIATVFEKTFGVFVTDYIDVLIFLVKRTLAGISAGKNIKLRVAPSAVGRMREELPELRKLIGNDVDVDILGDDTLSDQGCVIETEYGVYHCGADIQLENLITQLRALCI